MTGILAACIKNMVSLLRFREPELFTWSSVASTLLAFMLCVLKELTLLSFAPKSLKDSDFYTLAKSSHAKCYLF
jgi:hypothetical protein